jgi:hypothetical protein
VIDDPTWSKTVSPPLGSVGCAATGDATALGTVVEDGATLGTATSDGTVVEDGATLGTATGDATAIWLDTTRLRSIKPI